MWVVRSFRAFFVQEDRAPGRRGELLTKLAWFDCLCHHSLTQTHTDCDNNRC